MHPDSHHPPLPWHLGTFALVLALAAVLAALTPITLGLFLGGLALAALLVPFFASLWHNPRSALIAAACVTDAIAAVWLWPLFTDPAVHLGSWLGAYGILLAISLLQLALLPPLRRAGLAPSSAAGLIALAALLWLAAPIWLLPHLQSEALLPWMHRLIYIHPVFAINACLPTPIWTESPIAYTLLNLNQDIPYTLPSSPLPAILSHALPALAILCLIWIKAPNRTTR